MARSEWGIGVVGLGGIAHQHLESYRRRGLTVAGGMDVDASRAEEARQKFDLPFVTTDAEELIARPKVRVVDMTVPHFMEVRRPLVEAAARHGKPIFLQKPLMPTLRDAKTLVEIAEAGGSPLMVNQNSIFSPQTLALAPFLRRPDGDPSGSHWIGEPYYVQIENRAWADLSAHPWFGKSERWVHSDMAIHHFALVRHWFGDARSVTSLLTKDRSQAGVTGETGSTTMIRFESGVSGLVINNWSYRGPRSRPHPNEEIVIQGNRGTITADAHEVVVVGVDVERRVPVEGTWFPDAFGSAMAHFIDALDAGTPFLCSGRDNLKAVALIEAGYRSAAEGREVAVAEVLAEEEL